MQPSLRRVAAAAALAIATFASSTGALAAGADPVLLEAARAAQPAVVQSLKDMVSIESGSANAAGLAQMASYTEKRLKALGASVERVAVTKGPGTMIKGTFTGTGTRRIMLIAHMDTVYPANTLTTQPIHQEGNRLYGPGIADDKSGIAVILHALEILKNKGWHDYARITVLFNPDEEVGSVGSGETIAALAGQHDVVLSCEPTGARDAMGANGDFLLLGASGTAMATMQVKGRSAHAGLNPELGRNALVELAYQIQQTRDLAKQVPGTQMSWTEAGTGGTRNKIPESAFANADVRLLTTTASVEQLKVALQDKVDSSRLVPDTQTTITVKALRPAFVATAGGRAMAKHAQEIYAELDGRPLGLLDKTGGGTDAGYAGRSGKAAVVESWGLAGFGAHARDEYVELDSIVPRLYLMTRMLEDLGRN